LSDLKFAGDESLTVVAARAPDPVKVPLVDKDAVMVPELKGIISSWFQAFSGDYTREEVIQVSSMYGKEFSITDEEAQEIPDMLRGMARQGCVDFAEAITTVQDITVHDYRVTSLFEKYSRKLGNGNLILEEEFL